MRHNLLSLGSKISCGVVLAASTLSFSVTSASAVDYSGEAHCFQNGVSTDMLYPEDQYANGSLQNEGKIAAVEELNRNLWNLRLSSIPFAMERQTWRQATNASSRDEAVWGSLMLERAQRRANRRTGSKYFYITPNMKRLSHERSLVRSLKQKPCNPNILYLGTN